MKGVYLIIGITYLLIFPNAMFGQNTFSTVYNILQTNCAGSGCHEGSNAKSFDVMASENDLYVQLINDTVSNQTAKNKGDKLVLPGYPYRSFLLRKMAHGLSQDLNLDLAEGEAMPSDSVKLSDADIEIVRQWILWGAKKTGTTIDEQMIRDYYNSGGVPKVAPLPAPSPSEGFQLHEGPYFIAPGGEHEFFRKVELSLPDTMEIYKMEMKMHQYSHHFILYKYKPNGSQSVNAGARMVTSLFDEYNIQTKASTLATWQYDREVDLPQGTAYFWEPNTILDMNYHIPNYDPDSILAAEAYINFYVRRRQPATVQMFADLKSYGDFNPFSLYIPNDDKDTTYKMEQYFPGSHEVWNFWVLQAHTHSHGKDFDIYLRNPDGSKGAQVYEGFYNQNYTFYEGYYNWSHPSVRTFEPLLSVDMSKGLIHEAVYHNSGPAPVTFGLTSKDEMFITYYQYTKQPVATGINRQATKSEAGFEIYPNPFQSKFVISYDLPENADVQLEMFDVIGKKQITLMQEHQPAGRYYKSFDTAIEDLSNGFYILKLWINNTETTKKIIKTK